MLTAYLGAEIHDGATLHRGQAALFRGDVFAGMADPAALPAGAARIALVGGVICPGFVDLQVNGGGGVLFNDAPTLATLRRIAAAHATLGTAALLPTLITDTEAATRDAIAAVAAACAAGVAGIAGLHLEGPHLARSRCGAHDPALLRPMEARDLALLCEAARRLPALLVTLAPESVTNEQIARLAGAGIGVFLGQSDADYETCRAAFRAGASGVTHLFNAMSPLRHRAPGLVGAALDTPGIAAGLIADGVHVHPAALRLAWAARGTDLFLVTDAMATAASTIEGFELNGRRVVRRDGRLTLGDGTLAGADLEMARAVATMIGAAGPGRREAIAMATSIPGRILGDPDAGRLVAGRTRHALHLDPEAGIARRLGGARPRPEPPRPGRGDAASS